MASSRYWRIVGLEAYAGGDVELSELHLYGAAGRLDGGATLTCSHAPIDGDLSDLADDDTGTDARFAAAAVRSAGFFIAWDLGTAAEVIRVRLGAATSRDRFLSALTLQYFDGERWLAQSVYGRFPWPGALGMGEIPTAGGLNLPSAVLFMEGAVDFSDTSSAERTMVPRAGATISDVQKLYGPKSMLFNGTTGYVTSGSSSTLAFASGEDFTISFNAWKSANGSSGYDGVVSTTTNGSSTDGWFVELSATRGLALGGGGALIFNVSLNPNTSTWQNWEVSRKEGILRAFRHGVKIYEAADTQAYQQSGLTIGAEYPGSYLFNGYLDQVLILKGQALHDSDFTPASLLGLGGQTFEPRPVLASSRRSAIAASAPLGLHAARSMGAGMACDVEFGGPGTIYGTTKTKGAPNTPTKARVVLLHQRSKQPVRETWSDPVTGAFAFTGIDTNQQFITLAEDAAGNFRPVAANRLTPEGLP